MASDLETNIRNALEKLAKALADATEMTVETRYKVVDPTNPPDTVEDGVLAALTKIQLDGDHLAIVPVTTTDAGSVIMEDTLLDFHLRNVHAAIEYRTNALNTLVNIGRRRTL